MRSYLLLLLLATAELLVAFAPLPVPAVMPQDRSFRIDAQQFAAAIAVLGVLTLVKRN